MLDLKGQTAVVFGLANKRSIAWAIAQKLSAAGARIAICYQNERLRQEAEALAGEGGDVDGADLPCRQLGPVVTEDAEREPRQGTAHRQAVLPGRRCM